MSTSTFGYHGAEDRVWLSSSDWDERLWLTRRQVHHLVKTLAQALEQAAPGDGDGNARAARVHDASLNRPAGGSSKKPLQVGRDTAAQAAEASYALCTSVVTIVGNAHIKVQFNIAGSHRSLEFDHAGMHRWLHALYMVLRQADWNLPDLPDWLTRSYLPPALQNILNMPLNGVDADEADDEPHAPGKPPSPPSTPDRKE